MRNKLKRLFESLFSIFIIIAIIGGGVVFMMFVAGIILGGNLGNLLALSTRNVVMPVFIRFAAIAVLLGLLHHYIVGEHALTMD